MLKGSIDLQREGGEALTEEELILSLCREAREEGSEADLIKKFREKYRDQSELIEMLSVETNHQQSNHIGLYYLRLALYTRNFVPLLPH